jgi:hypothetical protein
MGQRIHCGDIIEQLRRYPTVIAQGGCKLDENWDMNASVAAKFFPFFNDAHRILETWCLTNRWQTHETFSRLACWWLD